MTVLRFSIQGSEVHFGSQKRPLLMKNGCNEPFKGRYWCPRLQWFTTEECPFVNRRECDNFLSMCGSL